MPVGVQYAIGAGPNLVSLNVSTGGSYVDIEGDNVNIIEHASNTALALKAHGNTRPRVIEISIIKRV